MPWKRFEFRGQTVFVRVLQTGKPIVRKGLVEFRYKLGASKSYRSHRDGLDELPDDDELIEDAEFGGRAQVPKKGPKEAPDNPRTPETVIIFTDGACSGNPGPAGLGVWIRRPDSVLEYGEFVGSATNNIAELSAILKGLEEISEEEAKGRVHLYTDSAWCLGVLVGGWKAKANLALINKIKEQMERFEDLELLKVKGHAGNYGNEEADRLATTAVRREDSSRKQRKRYPEDDGA